MQTINFIVEILIFIYALSIMSAYLILAILSISEMNRYLQRTFNLNHRDILASPMAPKVSLIAPAYNESLTIIDNIKSLLAIHYSKFEVIIVNDGSKDDSVEKVIKYFDLVEVKPAYETTLDHKPIRGVYKSKNRAYKKLIVVDKVNGGKADALNAGINVASNDLVACIDVDCIIESDAILKMVKPFLDETKYEVIASGGVVRIANSCVVEDGRLIKAVLPDNLLARFQVLEYIRAFLLGRMAWARIDGLLLISGAFGMFKREVVLKCGGYNHKTVGEDMELVVRMRKWMTQQKRKYQVTFIPDPLCWTEAPSTRQVLGRQRNRWTRGTYETLKFHKELFFNPKYGAMGLISYPFWFFFEWLAPFIEAIGLIYFGVLVVLGMLNWSFFLLMLGLVYAFAAHISLISILLEELSFFKYSRRKDFYKMVLTALIEPFVYHPRVVWWALKGNFDLWKGKTTWGEMSRTGFVKYKKSPN
jgi:biofilm PGA synthesis N-glycosyltransferase PgaC